MKGIIAGIVAVVFVVVALSAVFTVRETEQALVIRFGRVVGAPITEPGLHFKMPIVDEVAYVDRRLLSVSTQKEEVITEDQKRLVLDAFARFRIADSLRFFQTVKTDFAAESRMSTILNSALRRVIGTQEMDDVLSGERANLMLQIRTAVNKEAQILGLMWWMFESVASTCQITFHSQFLGGCKRKDSKKHNAFVPKETSNLDVFVLLPIVRL